MPFELPPPPVPIEFPVYFGPGDGETVVTFKSPPPPYLRWTPEGWVDALEGDDEAEVYVRTLSGVYVHWPMREYV